VSSVWCGLNKEKRKYYLAKEGGKERGSAFKKLMDTRGVLVNFKEILI